MNISEIKIAAIALARADGVGPITAQKLLDQFGSALNVFKADDQSLIAMGCQKKLIQSLRDQVNWNQAANEAEDVLNEGGEIHERGSVGYPNKLNACPDGPIVLFSKGNLNPNMKRVIAVVGTRNSSDYGKKICEQLIRELQVYDVTIVSGLAFGIDVIAHREALRNGMATVACLAHGIDRIYPSNHAGTAREMLEKGGWISEFPPHKKPERQNFPSRNRIIAGMADATVVVESNVKGGSMITGRIAASYHREVFAVPGALTNEVSKGPNFLIKNMEAQLLLNAKQIAEELGWEKLKAPAMQMSLLLDLNEDEQKVVDLLSQKKMHISMLELALQSRSSSLSLTLLNMEMKSLIKLYPGQYYGLDL
ncbi:MAG: DNA processing protein [Flavobacteriales bacterium]|jgi:DNA processing protein